MELLYFILCSYGITFIMVYGSIFDSIRPSTGTMGRLFKCPLCVGFWAGVFLWSINGFTELFNFDYNIINPLLLGWLSAGTSYFISSIIEDDGLNIKINKR